LTPMLLEANISKTAGDTGFVPKDHQ